MFVFAVYLLWLCCVWLFVVVVWCVMCGVCVVVVVVVVFDCVLRYCVACC